MSAVFFHSPYLVASTGRSEYRQERTNLLSTKYGRFSLACLSKIASCESTCVLLSCMLSCPSMHVGRNMHDGKKSGKFRLRLCTGCTAVL
jgi:hypothetical protein